MSVVAPMLRGHQEMAPGSAAAQAIGSGAAPVVQDGSAIKKKEPKGSFFFAICRRERLQKWSF